MSKVLIVDKSIDRKKRIAALKERGLSVFPALQLADARSRCRPGAYDLIIVNAQDEPDAAASFCQELSGRTPAQPVLLVVANGSEASGGDYMVEEDPEILAQRAAAVLDRLSEAPGKSKEDDRERPPARATA
jgi:DNA-binding response OmpR family regulator